MEYDELSEIDMDMLQGLQEGIGHIICTIKALEYAMSNIRFMDELISKMIIESLLKYYEADALCELVNEVQNNLITQEEDIEQIKQIDK